MEKDKWVLEIPYGTRDFLPCEAAQKRRIEDKLADLFNAWGYDEVVTPTIEYLDTLTRGNGRDLSPHILKFVGLDNRTIALRHEMTTPIARVVASRLRDEVLPLKLSYISNVYRYERTQMGRQCEFYQAGVESIGEASASADAEIIALAIEGLLTAGLKDFQVCIGHVEFIKGILQQAHLSAEEQERVQQAMVTRNLVDLQAFIEQTALPENTKQLLRELPLFHGKDDLLRQAARSVVHPQCRRALDNLSEIKRLLEIYGVAQYVTFDLGIIRDFNYYTGMVFEAYTPGLGFPLFGGGRYDQLLSSFGSACPATGFAIGIERILLALERQELEKPQIRKDLYIAYAEGQQEKAIAKACEMRKSGKVVELSLLAQDEKAAQFYQQSKNYQELIYIK